MKLFTRYNRFNIAITIFIFVAGSIAFYFVLHYVLIRQLDETLRVEQQEVVDFVRLQGKLPSIQNTKTQWITISNATDSLTNNTITSLSVYNPKDEEPETVRQLSFSVSTNGQWFLVRVNKSETETEDLLQLIILVTIGMIALMLLSNYLINRKIIGRLWQPFYNTIDQIKNYRVDSHQSLQLSKEPIEEIDLLNESLSKMTERIHRDYHSLKTFTENASHEIQTPLAIIHTKIEALLQDMEGNQKNMKQLLVIEEAAMKLSRLHQSLLLLTKLENRQFPLNENINLTQIIKSKIEERNDLIEAKLLTIHFDCQEVSLPFHQHLAEMLVSNLLNNCIRYTPESGTINIELCKEGLFLKNTATGKTLDKDKLFQRFYREEPSGGGTGLGLSIIREICLAAGFVATYRFIDNQHAFYINFSTDKP